MPAHTLNSLLTKSQQILDDANTDQSLTPLILTQSDPDPFATIPKECIQVYNNLIKSLEITARQLASLDKCLNQIENVIVNDPLLTTNQKRKILGTLKINAGI